MRNTNRVLAAAVVAFSLSVAGGPAVVAQEPTGTVTQGVVVTDKPDNPNKPPKEDKPNKPPKEDKPGRPAKNTAPVIVGAVDATIELDSAFNALDGVTATDKEDGDLTSSITVTGTVDTATPGPYTITYQVTDSGNLTTAESRVITVNTAPEPEPVPNTTPVLTGVTDATITEGDEFMPLYGVTATDTEDGDLTAAITVTGYVDTLTIGDYSLTYQVTDTGGLTATASRTITVIAAEPIQGIPPTITGVDDITIIEGDPFDPYSGVTATDNDGNDLTSDVIVAGTVDTSTPGVYTLTYTVTDTSGTSETVTRNVTVLANTAPTLDGVTDVTIREGDTFDPMAGVTATDAEDGDLTDHVTITGTVDTDAPGDYQLTYTVIDSRGKDTSRLRVVTVTPNLAPTITGADDTTITVGDTFDPTFGVTAIDAEDGDITEQVVVTGTVNTATVGVYTLTYAVTDTGGKSVTVTRSVTVEPEPNWAPVLDGVTNESIIEGATFDPLAGVTATDHEDGDLTGRVIITGQVDTTTPGQYLLTYSVTDTAGETVTATRVITVVFNQPPTLSGVDGAAVTVGDTFDALAGVTALDAEDGDLTDAIVVTGTVNTGTVGVYTITYTVTDAHGKSTSADRPVTVNTAPNTEPILAGVTDTSIIEGATFDPTAGVTATDVEDGDLTADITIAGTVNTGTPGVYDLTYRVTDTAGATVTAARTVTVIANAAPTITGADDTTITVGDVFDPATGVTATDAEDGDLTDAITITGTVDTGTVGVYTLTYEVTDSNGKTATTIRTVTVNPVPNTEPVLFGVTDTTVTEGDRFDPSAGVTAHDAEDGDLTAAIAITGTVDTGTPGAYTLTYTVTDTGGLTTTATRTVTVTESTADPYITDYERAVTDKVFELVNAHRISIGIDPLIRDADIDTVAYAWSQVMADQGTMYHNPNYATQMPDGSYRAAENVVSSSMTYTDTNRMATLIVNTWLGSDGHRATIENPNYTHTGIGFQVAENGAIYGTQNFGDYTP